MSQLNQLKHTNGRRGRGAADSQSTRKRFLIVCEGKVTETLYFEAFPVSRDVYVTVKGEGKNTTSLVAAAKRHAKMAREKKNPYDEIWVVYDKDDFSAEQFNSAESQIQSCREKYHPEGWYAAWSNQAFEVWYLLHFIDFDGRLHRRLVQKKVDENLRASGLSPQYRKNLPDMYHLLQPLQEQAIRRAEALAKFHGISPFGYTSPADANPCTTVFRLVQSLNAEIR